MPLIVAVAFLMSMGVLSACMEWRAHGLYSRWSQPIPSFRFRRACRQNHPSLFPSFWCF